MTGVPANRADSVWLTHSDATVIYAGCVTRQVAMPLSVRSPKYVMYPLPCSRSRRQPRLRQQGADDADQLRWTGEKNGGAKEAARSHSRAPSSPASQRARRAHPAALPGEQDINGPAGYLATQAIR